MRSEVRPGAGEHTASAFLAPEVMLAAWVPMTLAAKLFPWMATRLPTELLRGDTLEMVGLPAMTRKGSTLSRAREAANKIRVQQAVDTC
jgi:hypothetical protein